MLLKVKLDELDELLSREDLTEVFNSVDQDILISMIRILMLST